jgi:Zn-dependent M28 family amino/carboxypeptidase
MRARDLGFFLRGRVNNALARVLNARRQAAPVASLSLPAVLGLRDPSPLDLARVLEGRGNAERETMVGRYLAARAVPFTTHRFESFEGAGKNFVVEAGGGDRVLVLIAHHDAVPGSPGANDNAAAVGILLRLLARALATPPAGLRVRFLFTAAEERGYLGARAYVRETDQRGVAGVVSLELCGIGDTLALWDAAEETPLVRAFGRAVAELGYRRDEGYHVVGRIPVFGSDHRAFWEAGVPACGLTIVPGREADGLRQFIFNPWRSAFRQLVRRPPPFDTYHTSRDRSETLDPRALDRVGVALEALIRSF